MNISRNDLDLSISLILDFLAKIQNQDGSFDTYFLQPYYNSDKGWMKFPKNAAFDVASVIAPLFQVNSAISTNLVNTGIEFIKDHSQDNRLWYYPELTKDYLPFFDSDSTALCSYVLEKSGFRVNNKSLLDTFIRNSEYDVFLIPSKIIREISIATNIHVWLHNYKVKKGLVLKNKLVNITDQDFVVDCNVLLYVGSTDKNRLVTKTLKNKFVSKEINHLYYPTKFQALYSYSRLCYFRPELNLKPDVTVLRAYANELYIQLTQDSEKINHVLFAVALLYFDFEIQHHERLFLDCFLAIENKLFEQSSPFYSGNIQLDVQPNIGLPNTYFGSPAITGSLCIEFLNLYRLRFYGSHFGQIEL